MAHSDKTLWQSMQEEASDKLNRIDGDSIDLVCFAILVGEGDQAIFDGDEALVDTATRWV